MNMAEVTEADRPAARKLAPAIARLSTWFRSCVAERWFGLFKPTRFLDHATIR
jgi:hypothetical protein